MAINALDRSSAVVEYQQRIEHVLHYMEQNAAEPLTVARLAEVAGFSPYHFHRIFSAFVGETLGERLRRIRLEQARAALATSSAPITVIALDAGYATPAAFTKAFKREYAITPSDARRSANSITRPVSMHLVQNPQRSMEMQPEIRQYPERKVILAESRGLVDHNFNDAARRAFQTLEAYIGRTGAQPELGECFGMAPDEMDDVADSERRYQAGFFLVGNRSLPSEEGVVATIMPGGRTAVFTHRGPYELLHKSWESVYHDWLPTSGETPSDKTPYEVYVDDPSVTEPGELVTEICIPIL